MQKTLLGILVSSLVAVSVPQFAVAAGHDHARKADRAPAVKKEQPAAQMRHGCGLIRRLNGVQGMAVAKRDERQRDTSRKAFDNLPARIALAV